MIDPTEERVDQFIIYAGYGEVMHRLQVLELSLWMIQARGLIKRIAGRLTRVRSRRGACGT